MVRKPEELEKRECQAEEAKSAPRQPKRGCPWLNDSSIVRVYLESPTHVWSNDFVQDHAHDGNPFHSRCLLYRREFNGNLRSCSGERLTPVIIVDIDIGTEKVADSILMRVVGVEPFQALLAHVGVDHANWCASFS